MNGRVAKKIRKGIEKAVEINIQKTYVGLIKSLMGLPLKKRLKFSYCVIFKRKYK